MAEEKEKKDSSIDKINSVAQKGKTAYNTYKNAKRAYNAIKVARAGWAAGEGVAAAAATSEVWVPAAVIGLIVGLIAVVIILLFVIVSGVMGGDLSNLPSSNGEGNSSPSATLSPGQKPSEKFYCQWGQSWSNQSYDSGTVGGMGCAPTSMAMILSSFGVNKNPGEVATMFHNNGWDWRPGSGLLGTNPWRVTGSWLNSLGLDRAQSDIVNNDQGTSSINLASIKNYTDAGWLLYAAIHGRNLPVPVNGGHQIVIENADPSSKTVTIRDPNNCANGISTIPVSDIYLWYLVTPIRIKGQ